MALPALNATFASSANLPRKQMLAKWLVEELGSGSIADYYDLPERYLWAKIAVAAGAPKNEADYISLPKNYAWSDIYNAVSGDIAQSTVVVSGLSDSQYNGSYVYDGLVNGRPSYRLNANISIYWEPVDNAWIFGNPAADEIIASDSNVNYPWLASNWYELGANGFNPTGLVITVQTPNHTDWSENVALGHIAAAYRGDTANPANLATYIDWPWRYKVASIIDHLIGNYNAVIVFGAGSAEVNGTYTKRGINLGKPYYNLIGEPNTPDQSSIFWDGTNWRIIDSITDTMYISEGNVNFSWQATEWTAVNGSNPEPTLTPTNV